MIVVTGATGNVGRPLVRALVEAGEEVTAVSRTMPDDFPQARHERADLAEPESLRSALRGAEALFLLTAPDFLAKGDLGRVTKVAREAGVRRVVLLSSHGVGTRRHPPDLEDAVKDSGLDWTMLRPGNFSSNALAWADSVRSRRTVAAPFGDVALPAIDPADIAEVAARTLREPGHGRKTYTLTGPAPISPRQQAAAIAAALGEPVRFVELGRARARDRMLQAMPAPVVDATLAVLGTPSVGEQSVSADVPRLLGRPARTFDDWVARHLVAFT